MFTIKTDKLKRFLSKANSVASGGFLAISDYLLIESNPKTNEIKITKTGDGATIQEIIEGVTSKKEKILCDIRALSVIVSNGDEIEFTSIGQNVILKCGNSTTTVVAPSEDDYLSLIEDTCKSETVYQLNTELIAEINKCASIASLLSSQYDPRYNNVHLQSKGDKIELMGTCGSGMYISKVSGNIGDNLLIHKKACEAICKHPTIELVPFDNKLCFSDGGTSYAFNKTEQSFLSAYEGILSYHEKEFNRQAIAAKGVILSFCSQAAKIFNNKNVPISLNVKNGVATLVSDNAFLGLNLASELQGEFNADISIMFSSETISTVLSVFDDDVVNISFHEKSMSIRGGNDNAIGIVYLLTNQS